MNKTIMILCFMYIEASSPLMPKYTYIVRSNTDWKYKWFSTYQHFSKISGAKFAYIRIYLHGYGSQLIQFRIFVFYLSYSIGRKRKIEMSKTQKVKNEKVENTILKTRNVNTKTLYTFTSKFPFSTCHCAFSISCFCLFAIFFSFFSSFCVFAFSSFFIWQFPIYVDLFYWKKVINIKKLLQYNLPTNNDYFIRYIYIYIYVLRLHQIGHFSSFR